MFLINSAPQHHSFHSTASSLSSSFSLLCCYRGVSTSRSSFSLLQDLSWHILISTNQIVCSTIPCRGNSSSTTSVLGFYVRSQQQVSHFHLHWLHTIHLPQDKGSQDHFCISSKLHTDSLFLHSSLLFFNRNRTWWQLLLSWGIIVHGQLICFNDGLFETSELTSKLLHLLQFLFHKPFSCKLFKGIPWIRERTLCHGQ